MTHIILPPMRVNILSGKLKYTYIIDIMCVFGENLPKCACILQAVSSIFTENYVQNQKWDVLSNIFWQTLIRKRTLQLFRFRRVRPLNTISLV